MSRWRVAKQLNYLCEVKIAADLFSTHLHYLSFFCSEFLSPIIFKFFIARQFLVDKYCFKMFILEKDNDFEFELHLI